MPPQLMSVAAFGFKRNDLCDVQNNLLKLVNERGLVAEDLGSWDLELSRL